MLEIRDLTVAYGHDQILNGIDLELNAGDSLAIVGESGTGKTTLGHTIMGLCGGTVRGSILFNGGNLTALDSEAMRKIRWNQIAMVFQNVNHLLNPVYRIIDQVVEPMVEHGLRRKREAKDRAGEITSR